MTYRTTTVQRMPS